MVKLLLLLVHLRLLSRELLSRLLLDKGVVACLRLALYLLHGRLLRKDLLICLRHRLASICKKWVGACFWRAQRSRALIHGRSLMNSCVLKRALRLLWYLAKAW